MKIVLVLCAVMAAAVATPADTYNPKYDSFDAKTLVDNPRLLENYGKCFLGEGPCTSEGSDFKDLIPEAIQTTCAKCTPKQKELVRMVVRAYQEKLPEVWNKLVEKEDPEKQYAESFNNFIKGTD